jgi:hypothetical protein
MSGLRTSDTAAIKSIRDILVRVISDEAKAFYERSGFQRSP